MTVTNQHKRVCSRLPESTRSTPNANYSRNAINSKAQRYYGYTHELSRTYW